MKKKEKITNEQREMLTVLYEQNRSKMFRIAYSKLGNEQDALDAVHETFCRVMTDIGRFTEMPPDKRGVFLAVIVRNVAVDMYRKRINAPLEAEPETEIPDTSPDTETEVMSGITKQELVGFIRTLPDNQREILELTCLCGLNYEQAARYLGISENTAYQRIFRARTAIKKYMKEAENDEK
jgi:RNA polymerase sigma factor, sigma-70 family